MSGEQLFPGHSFYREKMFQVKIKDFQSISDASFEIENFTVIVGRNNLGKSAIIRSIDAALCNRPGNEFIKWGKTKAEVKLKKDALEIEWKKGDKASYLVNKVPYTSLNRAVPQPILDAGFKKLEIGDLKLNVLVAHQFDELFIVDRPGPVITDILSTIYDLNLISDADSLCQKKVRSNKALLKTRVSDLEEVSGELVKYKDFDKLKEEMTRLRALNGKCDSLRAEITNLESYINNLKLQSKEVEKAKKVLQVKLPDPEKIKGHLEDYLWLEESCVKFHKNLKVVQRLQPIKQAQVPTGDSENTNLLELKIIQDLYDRFSVNLHGVQRLKPIIHVEVPSGSAESALIQELLTMRTFLEQYSTQLLSYQKYQAIATDLVKIVDLTEKLNELETLVSDFGFVEDSNNSFKSQVTSAKAVAAELKRDTDEYALLKTECDQFGMCPLCGNSLKGDLCPK